MLCQIIYYQKHKFDIGSEIDWLTFGEPITTRGENGRRSTEKEKH